MRLDDRARELLYAIRASPDDDATRLVFADHIASTFPAHAAWIVAQCNGNDHPRLRKQFLDELPPGLRQITTRRGFVETLSLKASDFIAIDPDVVSRVAPTCARIELTEATDFDAIAARMQGVDSLVLRNTILDAARGRALGRAKGLSHLRALTIERSEFDDASIKELLASASFRGLERLTIDGYRTPIIGRPTWRTIRRIAKSSFAKSLRALDLSHGSFDDIVELVAALPNLRELGARGNRIDKRIAAVPRRLLRLDASDCAFDDEVGDALSKSHVLAEATGFSAVSNDWSADAVARWIAARAYGPLQDLELGGYGITGGAAVANAIAGTHLPNSLGALGLLMELGVDGATALASRAMRQLRSLNVGDLTPDGLTALARAPWMAQLEELWLYGRDDLDAASAETLAQALSDKVQLHVVARMPYAAFDILSERLGDRLHGSD